MDIQILCNRIEDFDIFSFIDKFLFLRANKSSKIVISIKKLNCNGKWGLVFVRATLMSLNFRSWTKSLLNNKRIPFVTHINLLSSYVL